MCCSKVEYIDFGWLVKENIDYLVEIDEESQQQNYHKIDHAKFNVWSEIFTEIRNLTGYIICLLYSVVQIMSH
jgi:hypothetical protein